MLKNLRAARPDLCFVAILVALAFIPLVALRNSTWSHHSLAGGICWAVWLCVAVAWLYCARSFTSQRADFEKRVPAERLSTFNTPHSASWRSTALVVLILTALTYICFYSPMTKHFWGGYDDFASLQDRSHFWDAGSDRAAGRPFMCIGSPWLAKLLTPDAIDGFLWVTALIVFLNSLLLYGIIRQLQPDVPGLAVAAAALLIASPTDPSRFYVLWVSMSYQTSLFVFLLSVWLQLLSYRCGSRGLLLVACCTLGAALLSHEGLFPLSVLGLVFLWLLPKPAENDFRGSAPATDTGGIARNQKERSTWSFAWVATIALMTARFTLHLYQRGANSYQLRQARGAWGNLADLGVNARRQLLRPLREYFLVSAPSAKYWWIALPVFGLVVLAILVKHKNIENSRRRIATGIGLAAVAVLFGVLPFIHMPSVFRTQFFAGPAQAALLASVVCLVGLRFPSRFRAAVLAVCTGLFVANATARSHVLQDNPDTNVRYDKVTHIFQQVHSIAPNLSQDTMVLLLLDDGIRTPLGCNYGLIKLSKLVVGGRVFQGNFAEPLGQNVQFGRDTVFIACDAEQAAGTYEYSYDRVLAFRVFGDGNIQLLHRLPEELLPAENSAERYRPFALLSPAAPPPLRYLRYSSCSRIPPDVILPGEGLLLGENWRDLEYASGELWRWASNGATVVVNPQGKTSRNLMLDMEPNPSFAGRPCQMNVLNESGKKVAHVTLTKRQSIPLSVPLDPTRVGYLRFVADEGALDSPGAAAEPVFRLFRPNVTKLDYDPTANATADICKTRGLRLGQNWYPLETYHGETFRWVNTDAEIIVPLGVESSCRLELELEPGPSLGDSPSDLQLKDMAGKLVATVPVRSRGTVHIEAPVLSDHASKYRLCIQSQGLPVRNDPRTLNFRVFRICRLASADQSSKR